MSDAADWLGSNKRCRLLHHTAWLPPGARACLSHPFPNRHAPPRPLPPHQVAPYLRGEWDTRKVGLLAPPEQRIQLAVDALLGAVPVWFKVGAACRVKSANVSQQLGRLPSSWDGLLCCALCLAAQQRHARPWWFVVGITRCF